MRDRGAHLGQAELGADLKPAQTFCHFPVTVQVTGTLTDEQLSQLAAHVEQAVTERLRTAERETGVVAGMHQVASYLAGGTQMPVPVPEESTGSAGFSESAESFLRCLRDQVISLGPDAVLNNLNDLISADERQVAGYSGFVPELEAIRAQLVIKRTARQLLGAEIDSIKEKFPGDVRHLAYEYLDLNKSFVHRERQRLGLGIPAESRSAQQADRLRGLARMALVPEIAWTLRRRLQDVPVGTMWGGVLGPRRDVCFDPRGKPPFLEPIPGRPTWEDVKSYHDRLSALIARRAGELPEIYLLMQARSLEGFAELNPAEQSGMLDYALHGLDHNIDDARDKIRSGDIDWLDLTPLQEKLFAGQRSLSGIDWSLPYHQQVARSVIGDHQQRDFWKNLGFSALIFAAFIFAEIATGGAAAFFLLTGVTGMGIQAAQAWQQAASLETAHAATASADLELVSRQRVLATDEAALFATVFFITGVAGSFETLAGRLGGAAAESSRLGGAVSASLTEQQLTRLARASGLIGGEDALAEATAREVVPATSEAVAGKAPASATSATPGESVPPTLPGIEAPGEPGVLPSAEPPAATEAAGPAEAAPEPGPATGRPVLDPSSLPEYASKDSFMNAMRRELLARRRAGNKSVLDFLLDEHGEWRKGTFATKTGRQIRGRYALSDPDATMVQAGHMQSDVYARAAGKREYLMLEDADFNWLTGQTGEAKGVYVNKPAVLIDGSFPVDIPTARFYESHGLLEPGTVDAAPYIEPPGL